MARQHHPARSGARRPPQTATTSAPPQSLFDLSPARIDLLGPSFRPASDELPERCDFVLLEPIIVAGDPQYAPLLLRQAEALEDQAKARYAAFALMLLEYPTKCDGETNGRYPRDGPETRPCHLS